MGKHLRDLRLTQWNYADKSLFYSILQHCPELESLEVSTEGESAKTFDTIIDDFAPPGCYATSEFFSQGSRALCHEVLIRHSVSERKSPDVFEPVDDACLEQSRESLLNIRHFSLHVNLAEEALDYILLAMPNLTSLSISYSRCLKFHNFVASLLKTELMLERLEADFRDMDSDLVLLLERYTASLQHLRLKDCRYLRQDSYFALSSCSKLRHVALDRARHLEDSHLQSLFLNAPDLEFLRVTRRADPREILCLTHVDALKKLRHLDLPKFNQESLRLLGNIPTLRHLRLPPFDLEALQSLAGLKNLRSLVMTDRPALSSKCLLWIIENFPKLESLELCGQNLSDAAGVKLCHLKNLKYLTLSDAPRITDKTFARGVGSSRMERLIVQGGLLTESVFSSIVAHHGRLREIRINLLEFSDSGFARLLMNEPFLQDLELDSFELFTKEALRPFEYSCPHFRSLVIRGISDVRSSPDVPFPTIKINGRNVQKDWRIVW